MRRFTHRAASGEAVWDQGGKVLNRPDRAQAVGSPTIPPTFWWALALSVALHAATLPALFRWRDTPPATVEMAAVELLIQPAEPASAPIDAAIVPAEPPALSVPQPPSEPIASPEQAPDPVPPATDPVPPAPDPVSPAPAPEPVVPAAPAKPAPSPEPLPAPQAVRRTSPPAAKPHPAQRAQAAPHATPLPVAPQTPDIDRPEPAPRADPAWLAGVGQWLLAHRSYPERARRQAQQGTVVVRIAVDPDGHVLDVSLVSSSGSVLLDQAAQALVRDAHLPPFPPDMKLARQSITLPIRYRLE